MTKTQAESFGKMEITGFAYSNDWLQRFKKRHGSSIYKFQGELDSADMEQIDSGRADIRSLLVNWAGTDIYNMDETGLFYRLTPSSTLANVRSGKLWPFAPTRTASTK